MTTFDLSERLKNYQKNVISHVETPTQPLDSAVLVLFLKQDNEDHLILNKRSENVAHHKGQICFPGGVCEEKDCNLWETALRETREEIGIESSKIEFLGELGTVTTPTGFKITPFVAQTRPPIEYTLNEEVSELILVPLSFLMEPTNVVFEEKIYFGKNYPDPTYNYQGHKIWGATAKIIVELTELIRKF